MVLAESLAEVVATCWSSITEREIAPADSLAADCAVCWSSRIERAIVPVDSSTVVFAVSVISAMVRLTAPVAWAPASLMMRASSCELSIIVLV